MTDLPPDWQRVFDRLERDRKNADERADKLQASLDSLANLMAKQTDELTAIRKMLRRRETQLSQAERKIRALRRKLDLDPDPEPIAAEVPEPNDVTDQDDDHADQDLMPQPGDGTQASAGEDVASDEPSHSDAEPRTKKRGGGRGRPPTELPADQERHNVCVCGVCGGKVLKRDVRRTELYTVVSTYARRRVIDREVVVCADPACAARTTAPMPPMPHNRTLYDCAFIAWLVTMKFAYLMPLDRMRLLLASQGVDIAMGTLVRLIERATELADAVDGEHMKQLKAGKYICFDGTGIKVRMQHQDKCWDGYLEVFARDHLSVFQFDVTKHASDLRDRLSNISAVLVTDAESRNKAGAPGAVFAHCNAHMVRKLREAERVQPILAKEGRVFLSELYDVDRDARRLELTGIALQAYRRRRCRPILTRLRRWLRNVVSGDLPPTDPVRKAAQYYLNHWQGLTRWVGDPNLPVDNNAAEREFQRHAKLRYASLFAGSIEGAHRWATLLGVVRTAQKLDLDVQAYLTWMFERRGTHRGEFGLRARSLTPEAYKAAGCPGSIASPVLLAA